MDELQQLYQEIILDHARKPRNLGHLDAAAISQVANNPVCGDHLILYLTVQDNKVKQVSFEGSGCAISMASASLMTEEIKGKSLDDSMGLFRAFIASVTNKKPDRALGRLDALAGVKAFPSRIKCATLAWHALEHAVGRAVGRDSRSDRAKQNDVVVTTE